MKLFFRFSLSSLVLLTAIAAHAESSRPNEDAMFGAPPSSTKKKKVEPAKPAPARGEKSRDAMELENANGSRDAFASGEATDNALTLGGKYYQRLTLSGQDGLKVGDSPLSLPLQFDGFMDARPNDRLRGFVDGRLLYDPSRDAYSRATNGAGAGSFQYSSTSAAPTSLSSITAGTTPNNPAVVLDQAWLKFDVERTVFVTAGKQHVKWGTSRFFNPTDVLSTQRRDPLLPYDLRLGNMMAKFDLPFEKKKTNLSAIALLDNPDPASSLGQIGGAFRAETVLGSSEVGIEAVVRNSRGPMYGADISTPLGPFDFYAEAAYLSNAPNLFYQLNGSLASGSNIATLVTPVDRSGPFVQASAGANYLFGWKENRQATVGVEYFYNGLGYDDAKLYPALIFFNQYQPFYTAKHYAAFYLTAEGPDEEKHTTFTFSTLGNLSDMSFISRLDFTWRILTYLSFEGYADVHYGNEGGEFNFSLDTPALTYQGNAVAPIKIARTLFDLGLGFRISF